MLKIVIKVNVEHAENDTSSNGDVPPGLADSDESFRARGYAFGSSTSTSEQATKSVLSPPPPPPPPTLSGTGVSPGPSTSSVKTTKAPVRSALGNDNSVLFDDIKKGIKLKSVEERGQLPNKPNIENSMDLKNVFERVLGKNRQFIDPDLAEIQDEGNDEDWADEPKTLGSETTTQSIAIPSKTQSQKITNTYGRFFSNPHSSKTEEIQPPNENSCTL